MKKGFLVKCGVVTLAVAVLSVFSFGTVAFAQVTPAEPVATAVVTAATPTTSTGNMTEGKHMLEWGVLAIVCGEFAGTIGMALSNIRKQKRAEAEAAAKAIAPAKNDNVFLYHEYKEQLNRPEEKAAGFGLQLPRRAFSYGTTK